MADKKTALVAAGGGQSSSKDKKKLDPPMSPNIAVEMSPSDNSMINNITTASSASNINDITGENMKFSLESKMLNCDQREAASYIQDMSIGMRNIANDSGLTFLAYLLDMAAEQAESNANSESSNAAEGLSETSNVPRQRGN